MKLAVVLAERFFRQDDILASKGGALSFVKDAFPEAHITVYGMDGGPQNVLSRSTVAAENFRKLPKVSSNIDYILKYLINKKMRVEISEIKEELINYDVVWFRTPGFAPLHLLWKCSQPEGNAPLCLNHICADAKNSWFNPKYRGFSQIPARLMSYAIHKALERISKRPSVITLATGDKIFSQYRYGSEVQMMIDTNIETENVRDINRGRPHRKSFTFGFLGRLSLDKGVRELIESMAIGDCSERLIIAGSGKDEDLFKEHVEHAGISDRVEFIGHLDHSKITDFFNSIDSLVIPSQNGYEGFPRVILESWAHGVPVVSTPAGGIRSFIDNRRNGVICKGYSVSDIRDGMDQIRNSTEFVISEDTWKVSQKSFWIQRLRSRNKARLQP